MPYQAFDQAFAMPHLVCESLALLGEGTNPEDLRLDSHKTTFQDCAPVWLVKAYKAINKPCIFEKVYMYDI
jgi:hypothetical protein